MNPEDHNRDEEEIDERTLEKLREEYADLTDDEVMEMMAIILRKLKQKPRVMVAFSNFEGLKKHVLPARFGPYLTLSIVDGKMIVGAPDPDDEFGQEFCLATTIIKDGRVYWHVNDGSEEGTVYSDVVFFTPPAWRRRR